MMAEFGGSFYAGWEQLSITIAVISVLASAILIVISRMFSLKQFEQTAKTEFVFAISTVIIVLVSLAVIELGESVFADPANGVGRALYFSTFGCDVNSPVRLEKESGGPWTAIDYVFLYMNPPRDCAIKAMDTLYLLSIPVGAAASLYTEVFMSEVASGFGFSPINERIKNTAQVLTFYLYVYYIFTYVLLFIKHFAGLFFSIGVALRAFAPTRGAGAYFMAAALGFYFVFPISYVIYATIALPQTWEQTALVEWTANMRAATGSTPYCDESAITAHFEEICSLPELVELRDAGCSSGDLEWVYEMMNVVRAHKAEISSFLSGKSSLPNITNILSIIRQIMNSVCIIPLIAMIVTMTFVLNTTNLFGGNIPEIGRGLVKLI
ncbi:MAG: hypothetical protein QW590_01395 [Candidatus Bilamarchaeaceae archaeon]